MQLPDETVEIARKLAAHQWASDFNSCTCGKSIPTIVDSEHCSYSPDDRRLAAHQARVLMEAPGV